MDYPISTFSGSSIPHLLREIPDAPQHIFVRGTLPHEEKFLTVVGSRDYSDYGRQSVEYLIGGLRGYPITIVSGLALGIDTLAHKAALDANLHTVAVPGSGIDDRVLYPRKNVPLAHAILRSGGALLSEFDPLFSATPWSFPQRNRIMAGLSHAVLVIEAKEKSGTLITARLTVEYNRELLIVPGSIFSPSSKGGHQFLKLGATPVTTPEDILAALHTEATTPKEPIKHLSPIHYSIYMLLERPLDKDSIVRSLNLPVHEVAIHLMDMELSGLVKELNGTFYRS